MSDDNYKIEVVATATGPDGQKYQEVKFVQYYDEGEAQVAHQMKLFPAIADAVRSVGEEFGAEDMTRRWNKKQGKGPAKK